MAQIGINFTDPVYRGSYHDKQVHHEDLDKVIQRAVKVGVKKFMVTGSDLEESKKAIEIARAYRKSRDPSPPACMIELTVPAGQCYATVGVHPCTAKSFIDHPSGPSDLLNQVRDLATTASQAGHAVAFGEFGLDYDRLFLTPKDIQLTYFEKQLDLAVELQLPLFLHSRAAASDFERLLKPRLPHLPKGGLVHSFTGTLDEMRRLVELGLDIGVNGCSLKSEENLAVVKEIPLERLQLETDGPWCEIRASHASAKMLEGSPEMPKAVKKEKWTREYMVKGRNEPCAIALVAHVVARVKGVRVEEVTEAAWRNSVRMFGLGEVV